MNLESGDDVKSSWVYVDYRVDYGLKKSQVQPSLLSLKGCVAIETH